MFSRIKNFFTQNPASSLIRPDFKPSYSFRSAAVKVGKGLVILGVKLGWETLTRYFNGQAPNLEESESNAAKLVTATGYALIVDGTFEATNLSLLYLYKKLEEPRSPVKRKPQRSEQSKSHKRKPDQSHQPEEQNTEDKSLALIPVNERKEIQRYHTLLKLQNLLRSSIGIMTTTFALYRYIKNIADLPQGISIFSLSFLKDISTSNAGFLNFLQAPIATPISIVFLSAGAIYNFREFALSWMSPRPRRGDVPLFGFINAYALIGTTAELGYLTRPVPFQNMDIIDPTGTNYEFIINYIQQLHEQTKPSTLHQSIAFGNQVASFSVYKNLMQILFNSIHSFSMLRRSTVHIEEEIDSSILTEQVSKPGSNPAAAPLGESRQPNDVPSPSISQPFLSLYQHQIAYGEQKRRAEGTEIRQRKSKATVPQPKGYDTPLTRLNDAATSLMASSRSSDTPMSERKETGELFHIDEKTREEGLETIHRFRNLSQVSRQQINALFRRVQGILPNARTIEGDGSERQLSWSYNARRFNLKFETTHGADNNQFKGNKLEKALNVLEAAFLWNWDLKKRKEYLEQRVGGRGLEHLFYIFSERPKG